jgi:DNA-binding CsgD family transcriptional regulator
MPGDVTAVDRMIGRAEDVAWIVDIVDRMVSSGGSVLLSGEAGIGKSTLLEAGAVEARRRGMRVLRAEGAEFESNLSYSALNQLLRPILDELDAVEQPLREALEVALGFRTGAAPLPLTVANAALAVLVQAGGADPVAVVVDDVQWVDPLSAVVLGMVARRTAGTKIGLIMAVRSGHPTLLSGAVMVERVVGPVNAAAARELALREQPGLTYFARERLVEVSGGNPLALIELGAAVAGDPDAIVASGSTLPLTQRLRLLYADRLRGLPVKTQALLLSAALEPSCDGGLLRLVGGVADAAAEMAPAVQDGLVELGRGTSVRFVHPLARSAVVSLAGPDERARTHRSLADALAHDSARRAWHLGQASTGPDEDIARQLDEAAPEVFARGDARNAIAAMTRAADLSPTPAARAQRLAKAAWFGVARTSDRGVAERLLAAAHESDPAVGDALFAAAVLPYLVVDGHGDVDAVHALLLKLYAETDLAEGPDEFVWVLNAHLTLASSTVRTDIWDSHSAALRRLGARAGVGQVLLDTFMRGPVAPKLILLPNLDAAVAGLDDSDDFHHIVTIASSATRLDQMQGCRSALERMVGRYGADGTNVLFVLAMQLLGIHAVDEGDWTRADRIVAEARTEAATDTLLGWLLETSAGTLAARRGQSEEVSRVCAALAERAPAARIVHLHHDVVRAEDAISRGEWVHGFELLRGVMPVENPFSELDVVPFLTLDFAEAAWHAGRPMEARAHVSAMREAGCARLSTRAALITVAAEAVVSADDDEAVPLFERALAGPGAQRWPWEFARVQLAYGRRLRRGRDARAARTPLAAAMETFERLGAVPWVAQAAIELKASGQGLVRRGPQSSALTAQELTIADLAARGLTNKQIAAKLALSPRTVSTHLYRIFPKLGVRSRAGLRDAMNGAAMPAESSADMAATDELI